MDGSVLVVGAPEAGVGGRTVHVFDNENGVFVERATVTPPGSGTPLSRFGQQVRPMSTRQTTLIFYTKTRLRHANLIAVLSCTVAHASPVSKCQCTPRHLSNGRVLCHVSSGDAPMTAAACPCPTISGEAGVAACSGGAVRYWAAAGGACATALCKGLRSAIK